MEERTEAPRGNIYPKYETSNAVERRIVSGFLRRLEKCLPSDPLARIVELGAGEGEVAETVRDRFSNASVFVMDLPDQRLGEHWKDKALTGFWGDIARLPLADKTSDLTLAIEVLEHIPNPEAALAEISRVTRGSVILSVPLEPWWRVANVMRGRYWGDWGNTPGHIQHWTRRGFVKLVSRYLHVREVHQPFPWTMLVADGLPNPG